MQTCYVDFLNTIETCGNVYQMNIESDMKRNHFAVQFVNVIQLYHQINDQNFFNEKRRNKIKSLL